MAKRATKRSKDDDRELLLKLAQSFEAGRFNEYVEVLQDSKKLLWKSFVAGIGRGFGAIVGATLVVALVVWIMAMLGDTLPGELGDFFEDTGNTINPTPQ